MSMDHLTRRSARELCAVILAVGTAVSILALTTAALIDAFLSPTGELSQAYSSLLTGTLGVMVGALAGYLGSRGSEHDQGAPPLDFDAYQPRHSDSAPTASIPVVTDETTSTAYASATDTVPLDVGGIAHASATERTVSGLVIPWNMPGPTTAGVLTIPGPGSVRLPRDVERVKLHFKHSGTEGHKPVGYATGYEVRPDGLWMNFRVARTVDGDHAISQVTEGVYDAFSAELAAMVRDGQTVRDSVMTGVALVDTPAFADARVTEVHAAHTPKETKENTMTIQDFIASLIAAGQSPEQARAMAVAQFGEAAVAEATKETEPPKKSAPKKLEEAPAAAEVAEAHASHSLRGPIVPAGLGAPSGPAIVHASAHEAAQTIAKMVSGRRGEVAHAALTDITNSGLIDAQPPGWLGELWSGPGKQRRIIPLLNHRDLRSWRVQGFKWTDKPLVATYAGDKAAIPTNPVAIEPFEAEAVRWAGGHDLDRKFFDFGDAEILDAYWRAMHESYAVVTDAAAGAFVVANATALTGGPSADLIDALIDVKYAVEDNVGVAPSYYLANPLDLKALRSPTNADKPAFFDMFNVTPESITWTKAVPQGTLVAGARPAVTHYELPGSPLRVEAEHLSHGGRDRALFGYTALTVDNADGLVKITFGTP